MADNDNGGTEATAPETRFAPHVEASDEHVSTDNAETKLTQAPHVSMHLEAQLDDSIAKMAPTPASIGAAPNAEKAPAQPNSLFVGLGNADTLVVRVPPPNSRVNPLKAPTQSNKQEEAPAEPLPATWKIVAAGVAGPVATGFVLGVTTSLHEAFLGAVKMPLVIGGTLLLAYPTLYVSTTLFGLANSPKRMLSGLVKGYYHASLVLLGFAPAFAWLSQGATHHTETLALATLSVVTAGALGLYSLLGASLIRPSARGLGIAGAWGLMTLFIGFRAFETLFV